MKSGQQVQVTTGQASSSRASTSANGRKRVAGSRPSSPILRGGGVKEESPEPELDEVRFNHTYSYHYQFRSSEDVR